MHDFFWFTLCVAFNAGLVTLLAANVSRLRIRERVPNGDGDKVVLRKAVRAHGNGVEHVGIFALLVLALSLQTLPAGVLAGLVGCFSLGRVLHAWGMLGRQFNARRSGAGLTYLAEVTAVALLFAYGVM